MGIAFGDAGWYDRGPFTGGKAIQMRLSRDVKRNSNVAGIVAFLMMAAMITFGNAASGAGWYWLETLIFSSAAGFTAWFFVRSAAFASGWLRGRKRR